MRIGLLILMTLSMLVATGMGLMIANENVGGGEGAQRMGELETMLESFPDGEKKDEIVTMVSGYKKSGYGGAIVGLLALVMAIVTFMKKEGAVKAVAGATAVAAVLFIILCPSMETGATGPAPPRTQAMVYGIAAIVTAVTGFLAQKKASNQA